MILTSLFSLVFQFCCLWHSEADGRTPFFNHLRQNGPNSAYPRENWTNTEFCFCLWHSPFFTLWPNLTAATAFAALPYFLPLKKNYFCNFTTSLLAQTFDFMLSILAETLKSQQPCGYKSKTCYIHSIMGRRGSVGKCEGNDFERNCQNYTWQPSEQQTDVWRCFELWVLREGLNVFEIMENSSSVYELITSLCDKFKPAGDGQRNPLSKAEQRRLRARCFEVLLSSRKWPNGTIICL